MKLVYLETSKPDLDWYRLYYRSIFAAGARKASKQYLRAVSNLLDNPRLGRPIDAHGVREYSIPRIPFSIIYRISDGRIEVLRIWDQRADRKTLGFDEEGTE
jgi:plasmid stabilization system protein ParE